METQLTAEVIEQANAAAIHLLRLSQIVLSMADPTNDDESLLSPYTEFDERTRRGENAYKQLASTCDADMAAIGAVEEHIPSARPAHTLCGESGRSMHRLAAKLGNRIHKAIHVQELKQRLMAWAGTKDKGTKKRQPKREPVPFEQVLAAFADEQQDMLRSRADIDRAIEDIGTETEILQKKFAPQWSDIDLPSKWASKLDVDLSTLHRWIDSGKIRVDKQRRTAWRIDVRDLERLLPA